MTLCHYIVAAVREVVYDCNLASDLSDSPDLDWEWAWKGVVVVLVAGIIISAPPGRYFFVDASSTTLRLEYHGGTSSRIIHPIQGSTSAVEFYQYVNNSPNTGFEAFETSLLIPYEAPSGVVSLIIVHDRSGGDSGGNASLRISGLPRQALLALRDDPDDYRDEFYFAPPEARLSWGWDRGRGDGAVITGIGKGDSLTLRSNFISGITSWELISDGPDGLIRIPLGLNSSINLSSVSRAGPFSSFTLSGHPVKDTSILFDASDSYSPEDSVAQYQWDFTGDGVYSTASSRPQVRHTFPKSGKHRVSLRVVDEDGRSTVSTRQIKVYEHPIEVRRSVSSGTVGPNSVFQVTLTISTYSKVVGLAVDEDLPESWEVTPVSEGSYSFKQDERQWIFLEPLPGDTTRTIKYDVRVPSPEELETYSLPRFEDISGTAEAANPSFQYDISQSSIRVREVLSPSKVIAHYRPDTGKLDLRTSGKISKPQLNWAAGLWKSNEPVPGTGGELVDSELLKKLVVLHLRNQQVETSIPYTDKPRPDISREVSTKLPFNTVFSSKRLPGESTTSVRVEVSVNAKTRTLIGVGIKEIIPSTWEITILEGSEGIYKRATNEWIFLSPVQPGHPRKIFYRLDVPDNAQPHMFQFEGHCTEAWSGFKSSISGEESLHVTETLSVPVVIAKWDVERDDLNPSLGNSITFNQVQRAIKFWLHDSVVPYTEGKQLKLEDVKTIVAHWIEDVPITGSL